MSTWKLQKLVYYSQSWVLAWEERPLFTARIEAWANGPVTRTLYERHRREFSIDTWRHGDKARLTASEKDTIDRVLADYGSLTGRQLSLLTHSERPWQQAREGLPATAYGDREITRESIQTYYAALDADESVPAVADIDWAALEAS